MEIEGKVAIMQVFLLVVSVVLFQIVPQQK